MAGVTKIEDLEIWCLGRSINKRIYEISRQKHFFRDYALRDQIRRASISITSNIAEGFERSANSELIYFLGIAKGSSGEVLSLLYLAFDLEYINDNELLELTEEVKIIIRRIGKLIQYLQRSEIKGGRYKNNKRTPNPKP